MKLGSLEEERQISTSMPSDLRVSQHHDTQAHSVSRLESLMRHSTVYHGYYKYVLTIKRRHLGQAHQLMVTLTYREQGAEAGTVPPLESNDADGVCDPVAESLYVLIKTIKPQSIASDWVLQLNDKVQCNNYCVASTILLYPAQWRGSSVDHTTGGPVIRARAPRSSRR